MINAARRVWPILLLIELLYMAIVTGLPPVLSPTHTIP